jgi:soluble lytic murein transglycosylase
MKGACAKFLAACLCIAFPAAAFSAAPANPALPERNPQRPPATAAAPEAAEPAQTSAATEAEKADPAPEPPKPVVKLDPTLATPARNPQRLPSGSENGPPGLDAKKVLAPLLDYALSSSDAANLQEAVRAAYSGNGARASAAAARIQDESARKLATWYYYRSSALAPAWNIERFRLAHPDWPSQDTLRQRAEESLFLSKASPRAIEAFFRRTAPATGAGKAALAWALLQRGKKDDAKELAQAAWREHHFDHKVEKEILSRLSELLGADDHRGRIDRLLYTDRKSETAAARRIAKLLPEGDQKRVEARIAVINRGNNAGKLLDALPADAMNSDLGLRFNRIQWLRRQNERREEAWKTLIDTPTEPDRLVDLSEWWVERRINIRGSLNDGYPRIAYNIAKNRGPLTGNDFAEAEFLAGWIALRFLHEPETALEHFVALRKAITDAKEIARAEYWLGRTSLALGDAMTAAQHFRSAARFPQHYYGQLGRQALDGEMADLQVVPPPLPTQEHIDRFLARHSVRAIGVAMKAGLDNLTPQLFLQLARTLESGEEAGLLAELAYVTDKRQLSIRLSKIAFNRDLPVGYYAMPIGVLPSFKSLADEPADLALVHALSRQESEFNPKAQSPVGARGLMQLMPGTARMVARQYKIAYEQAALTANPTYNVQLGEAHLCDLLDNYNGSYILTLVAYNAGPGRVRQWVEQFGDPRNPDVDPIDWVERIPFTETREYVFKIMESMQLYRARLAGPRLSLRLWQDLHHGSKVMPPREGVLIEAQATAN